MGGQSVRARSGGVPCSGQGAVRRAHEADEDRAPAGREGVFLRSRGFEGVEEGAEGESEEGEVVDCVDLRGVCWRGWKKCFEQKEWASISSNNCS